MSVRVELLAEHHLPALAPLFEVNGSGCFCRYWHFGGTKNEWLDRCAHRPEENAEDLAADLRASSSRAMGLVAIRASGEREGAIVGWMKLTPRAAVAKLRALPVYRSLDLGDEATTFSVGCFLIDPRDRRHGVARALLVAADGFVRSAGGRALEGYPRRSEVPLYDEEAWQGPERLFVELGFSVVHDEGPYPVYRKILTP